MHMALPIVAAPLTLIGTLHYFLPLINSLSFSRESSGTNAGYSKFAKPIVPSVPSRLGMFTFYFPAMLIGLAGICLNLPSLVPSSLLGLLSDNRALLVSTMVFVHFAKRVLEVLFLHRHSGVIEKELLITISVFYALTSFSAITLTTQASSALVPVSSPAMVIVGSTLFLLGELGNLYHHSLLASLRSSAKGKDEERTYKEPKGGLFPWIVCPHYLFELVAFLGLTIASQNVYCFLNLIGMASYLSGRSAATKAWYETKSIPGFPGDRKAIVPFVF